MFDGVAAADFDLGQAEGGSLGQAGLLFVGGEGFEVAFELFVEFAVYAVLAKKGLEAGFYVVQQVHGGSPPIFLCSAGIKASANAGPSTSFPLVTALRMTISWVKTLNARDDNSVCELRALQR
jgi:hypothetical protein